MLLSTLNTQLEESNTLPGEVWDEWLWGTNPEEKYHADVLLNRNHLLGLLICRYKYLTGNKVQTSLSDKNDPRMTIMEKPVHDMTWRELKDTIANIQLEWPAFIDRLKHNQSAKQNLNAVVELIHACCSRFGCLCMHAFDQTVLDDATEANPLPENTDVCVLTKSSMRRVLGSIHMLYRHLHLLAVAKTLPPVHFDCGVKHHHYQVYS